MQTQFQLGSYIHACTNETHSLPNLQDLITTFGWFVLLIVMPAKVIKSCRFARECVHLCMHGCNYPAGIVFA